MEITYNGEKYTFHYVPLAILEKYIEDRDLDVILPYVKKADSLIELVRIFPELIQYYENNSLALGSLCAKANINCVHYMEVGLRVSVLEDIAKYYPQHLRGLNNLHRDYYIKMVEANPNSFPYLPHDDQYFVKMALERDSSLIKHIQDPSDDLIKLAVSDSITNLRLISNLTHELKLDIIKETPASISLIEDLSDDLVEYAVSLDGSVLALCDNQWPELCIKAIENNPFAITHVKTPTVEMYRLAFSKDPWSFKAIKGKTADILEIAVEYDLTNLEHYTKEVSYRILKKLTEQHSRQDILHRCNKPSNKFILESIEEDPSLIAFVDLSVINKKVAEAYLRAKVKESRFPEFIHSLLSNFFNTKDDLLYLLREGLVIMDEIPMDLRMESKVFACEDVGSFSTLQDLVI